jgi:ZIP family zinc transporter
MEGAILAALLAGLAAAAATAAGAVPALFVRALTPRTEDTLLGFGAGIMLCAAALALIHPALVGARQLGAGAWGSGALVGSAILLGAGLIMAMERALPHEHFIKGTEGHAPDRVARSWLFVFAICLHNLPEGLVVALALLAAGYRRGTAVLAGMASGLIEPVGAVAGAALATASPWLLPGGLGLSAGAMLYVVSHEVIPESHRQGHESFATAGLMLGFVLMLVLDSGLGNGLA